MGRGGSQVAVLSRVVRICPIEKMKFEQRLKGGRDLRIVYIHVFYICLYLVEECSRQRDQLCVSKEASGVRGLQSSRT